MVTFAGFDWSLSVGRGPIGRFTYPSVNYPTAGTVLASVCDGTVYEGGPEYVYDALGTEWYGSYYKWQLIADGSGGSSWSMLGGVSADCAPYGFVYSGFSRNNQLNWEHSGTAGTYDWSNEWDVYYFDGNGGTLHEAGLYEFHPYGYTIADGWAEGRVIYTGSGTWSFWYNYGYQLSSGWDNVLANWGCGDVALYQYEYIEYADGSGGSYRSWTGNYYIPSYGNFLQECNGYNYYTNGNGGYYTEAVSNPCPSYGTELSSDSGTLTADWGCGSVVIGYWGSTTYADGNCGTYGTGGQSTDYNNGQLIQNCGDYNYYSNGSGGWYQGEYTGGGGGGSGCDPYGTWITGAQSGHNYINVGCGDWQIGDYDYDVYADGNCGTYTQTNWQNWSSYGTYLGNCSGNNYYSDGTGSYYSEGDGSGGGDGGGGGGCDPYGNYVGSGSYSNTYFINPSLTPEIGTTSYDTYTDGNCGTFDTNYSTTWYTYGTYLGNTYVIDQYMGPIQLYWHSDGAGGVYATLSI